MPKEMKTQSDEDKMYGYIQVTKTEVLKKPINKVESYKDLYKHTHTIYIFPPSRDSGIKLVVTENNGLYITNADSISIVKWDEEINSKPIFLSKQKEGSETVETFVVSEMEFKRICDAILNQLSNSNDVITISIKENKLEEFMNLNPDFINNIDMNSIKIDNMKSKRS